MITLDIDSKIELRQFVESFRSRGLGSRYLVLSEQTEGRGLFGGLHAGSGLKLRQRRTVLKGVGESDVGRVERGEEKRCRFSGGTWSTSILPQRMNL